MRKMVGGIGGGGEGGNGQVELRAEVGACSVGWMAYEVGCVCRGGEKDVGRPWVEAIKGRRVNRGLVV